MELTPQVINEVEFSLARKGYDPDQVDEFLEKVAVAVAAMQDRLAEARETASMAERRAADAERKLAERPERVVEVAAPSSEAAAPAVDADAELETVKRTLVLAQKTADATVREAEQEAAAIRTGAQKEAEDLLRTATERATSLQQEAEAMATQAGRAASERLKTELARLERSRDDLQAAVDEHERYLAENRQRLRSVVTDLERLLKPESPLLARSRAARPAAPSPVEVDEVPAAPKPKPAPGPVAEPTPTPAPRAEAPAAQESGGAAAQDPPAPEPAPTPAEEPSGSSERDERDAWARFAPGPADFDGGPPTEPAPRIEPEAPAPSDDDAYLAELRKAMLRDTAAPELRDLAGDDAVPRSRFGRRR